MTTNNFSQDIIGFKGTGQHHRERRVQTHLLLAELLEENVRLLVMRKSDTQLAFRYLEIGIERSIYFQCLCTGLYTASWQFDHCVKYQRDPSKLAKLPVLGALTQLSPVVPVRKDDSGLKILHCTVSLNCSCSVYLQILSNHKIIGFIGV
ncbi:hypothetical protein NQ317_016143 [Molorchus minor]|uniref:Uncharacterized protein n=1 Tax=Molorchus minor TaxID=1323400 RepID=A0ABQ9IZ41_9CUCU|nr:hypothetical protein NQ317_016143 [Molorchus minor]